jgi:hypothetical protein
MAEVVSTRLANLYKRVRSSLDAEFRQRAIGGYDWSAEDAYSSAAHDPTFAFVRGLCCSLHSILYLLFAYIYTFDTLL